MSAGLTTRIMSRFQPKLHRPRRSGRPGRGSHPVHQLGRATPPTSRILFVAVLLVGLGAATAFTPLLTMAVANVPAQDAGIGSGIVNVSQQVAAALSVAVLGAVSSSRTATLLAHGTSALDALDGGYRLAFGIALASVVIGIVLGSVILKRGDRAGRAPEAPTTIARRRPPRR